MKTIRLLLLILGLSLFMPTELHAQFKKITVTVMMQNADGSKRPLDGIPVNGFYNAGKAANVHGQIKKDMALIEKLMRGAEVVVKTNSEGFCEMELTANGAIIVVPRTGDPILEPVRNRLDITITIKDDGFTLGTTTVIGKAKNRSVPPPVRTGNQKTLGPLQYYLSENETRNDARFVMAPVIIELETGDTFAIARPFIKDGIEYQETQKRRMGFNENNDPLIAYRDEGFMREREESSVSIFLRLYPIKMKRHYKIVAKRWFEDYNRVYQMDSICLDEGYDREPMRFLEYNTMTLPIEMERYERIGKSERLDDKRQLNLNFKVGEAVLDPTDSLNMVQMNQLINDVKRYAFSTDAGITGIEIHGQSSPDGGIATNERLCLQRAQFLRTEIGRNFPQFAPGLYTVSADVASWSDVADLLEKDSLTAQAKEVRDIIAANTNTTVQETKIRALPYYEMIKEKILPRLRVVDFKFSYYTNRVKTPDEIYEQYLRDPDYHAGKKQMPYEFYELFKVVKDPKELEVLAREAYKSVRDASANNRPWALAAYLLAQCYLARDTFDTKLLEPYLDWSLAGTKLIEREKTHFDGSTFGWVNDAAIVTTHITMLCKAGDFYMADSVAYNLLANQPRFDKMKRFLDCLNGGWNDPVVRDTVANSSPWNRVVVYAAQDHEGASFFHEQALYLLSDTSQFDPEDPKVLYTQATLRFQLLGNNKNTTLELYPDIRFMYDDFFIPSENDPYVDDQGYQREDWGYPMVKCCLNDPKYLEYLRYDGNFTEKYRKSFQAYWEKNEQSLREEMAAKRAAEKAAAEAAAAQADGMATDGGGETDTDTDNLSDTPADEDGLQAGR